MNTEQGNGLTEKKDEQVALEGEEEKEMTVSQEEKNNMHSDWCTRAGGCYSVRYWKQGTVKSEVWGPTWEWRGGLKRFQSSSLDIQTKGKEERSAKSRCYWKGALT